MISLLRVPPSLSRALLLPRVGIPRASCRRLISSSRINRYTELSPEPEVEAEESSATPTQELVQEDHIAEPRSYAEFLQLVGEQYKYSKSRNWLGGNVPFPLNPSFKPPPPVSDALRTKIYRLFMADPEKNNIRSLSREFNLSLKRVDAILRLKGMEADWLKGKPLQTGFQFGMESILDVRRTREEPEDPRYDTHQADTLEEEENRDAARQRYQRLYWESVPEDGREPIVPLDLQRAKKQAKRLASRQEEHKSDAELMPILNNPKLFGSHPPKELFSSRTGHVPIRFVDVGGKYIDVKDRLRRMAGSQWRKRERPPLSRKALQKLQKFQNRQLLKQLKKPQNLQKLKKLQKLLKLQKLHPLTKHAPPHTS